MCCEGALQEFASGHTHGEVTEDKVMMPCWDIYSFSLGLSQATGICNLKYRLKNCSKTNIEKVTSGL